MMLLRVIVMTRATHGRCCNMSQRDDVLLQSRRLAYHDQRYGFTLVRLSHLGLLDEGIIPVQR